MSTIPAFINAIFTLNKKGEYPLYEGAIEGGYTKVLIVSKIASGYSTRYFKVKQIIALEGQQAIIQTFDLPSQEFAYRLIEKSIIENAYTQGEDNEENIPVVITGQQQSKQPARISKPNIVDPERIGEDTVYTEYNNNNAGTYQPVVTAQSRKLAEGHSKRQNMDLPDYNDAGFDQLAAFTGTGSDEFSSGEIKIANMSSFGNGSNSNRNRTKGNYSSLEEALDSGF